MAEINFSAICIFIVMKNISKIINEVIEDYIEDDGIKAVLFDFDFTLFDTSAFNGIDVEYIRSHNDISIVNNLIPQTKIYNGIIELLDYLNSKGIRTGIVSNRHELVINATLKYHNIGVDVVVGERQNSPKSVRISEALRKLGVSPNNAIYVGDSTWDNAEAHKAGMEFIGATWGNKRLIMGYNSPKEIIRYIEYMNS